MRTGICCEAASDAENGHVRTSYPCPSCIVSLWVISSCLAISTKHNRPHPHLAVSSSTSFASSLLLADRLSLNRSFLSDSGDTILNHFGCFSRPKKLRTAGTDRYSPPPGAWT